jgi:penicillin-binding protein-related factor A (putative recombinase)
MSENYLQGEILKYLLRRGAYAVNIHGDEYQSSVPDILVCYRGRFIGLELKDANGVLSPGQRKHLRKIQKAGGIGEGLRSMQRVKDILKTIDNSEVWINGTY